MSSNCEAIYYTICYFKMYSMSVYLLLSKNVFHVKTYHYKTIIASTFLYKNLILTFSIDILLIMLYITYNYNLYKYVLIIYFTLNQSNQIRFRIFFLLSNIDSETLYRTFVIRKNPRFINK